ncbi:hypothetical protein H0W80_04710 [Candidatus Saccharibacteria bacterium]|nr:hypothetical protein [Candidatus Saccharibacteria bacterium]
MLFQKQHNKSIIGIDIDTHSIKLVELQHNNKDQTMLIAYGSISRPAQVSDVTRAIFHILNTPQYGKFTAKTLHILDTSTPSESHTNHTTAVQQNLKNRGFRIEPITNQKIVLQMSCIAPNDKLPIALVDLNGTDTHIHLIGLDQPTMHFEIDTEESLHALASKLEVSKDQIWQILQKVGLSDTDLSTELRSYLKPLLEDLCEKLNSNISSLNEILSLTNKKPIQKIILSGELASTKGLCSYLANRVPYQFEVINPWQNSNIYPLKPMPRHHLPTYAKAICLATQLS